MKKIRILGVVAASFILMFAAVLFIQFNKSEKWSTYANQSMN